ncbi:MAG: hypothetical protein QUS66_00070, partial [Bacteroidota bacterium]|nr:hypothetical protein [Bacteroidota bacterium]
MEEKIRHIILECTDPACMMRFPVLLRGEVRDRCPMCGSHARHASAPYEEHQVISGARATGNFVIEALLDNIRSLY